MSVRNNKVFSKWSVLWKGIPSPNLGPILKKGRYHATYRMVCFRTRWTRIWAYFFDSTPPVPPSLINWVQTLKILSILSNTSNGMFFRTLNANTTSFSPSDPFQLLRYHHEHDRSNIEIIKIVKNRNTKVNEVES